MKHQLKLTLLRFLPKSIIFWLAAINFLFIYSHSSPIISSGGAVSFCCYCAWYVNWSFINEPSLLFLAALLIISRRWLSYLMAALLSGYIADAGLVHLIFGNMTLVERIEGIQAYQTNIFLAREMQWMLAGVVFTLAGICLIQHISSKNRLQNRLTEKI